MLFNEGDNFSVGANLMLVAMAASGGSFDDIAKMASALQAANQRMKYARVPVVAAAYGMETDAWRNQPVIIYAERGTWFGKDGWAVRLAIPAAVPTPAPAMPAYEEIMSEGMAI